MYIFNHLKKSHRIAGNYMMITKKWIQYTYLNFHCLLWIMILANGFNPFVWYDVNFSSPTVQHIYSLLFHILQRQWDHHIVWFYHRNRLELQLIPTFTFTWINKAVGKKIENQIEVLFRSDVYSNNFMKLTQKRDVFIHSKGHYETCLNHS